ncbi:4Fe-4S ferredoxin [Bacillota bacterium LX-D]|nr:4Fe-4S ferredoxin [Bacillota bacterium LX-D]
MKNYSDELLNSDGRKNYIEHFVSSIRNNAKHNLPKLDWAKNKLPLAYGFVRKMATANMKKFHFGQVIPLEDAEKVIDLVQSITRIPCICRSVTTGKNDARYCLLLGIDPTGLITHWPEIKSHLETITAAEAKKILEEFDKNGLVHSVWTFKTPFIGALCNCDHDCLAYRVQINSDLMNVMFKAEYIAQIEPILCTGCRSCQKYCQFGAIEYSIADSKCFINSLKCYGCGVCRRVCKKDAINLVDREDLSQTNIISRGY